MKHPWLERVRALTTAAPEPAPIAVDFTPPPPPPPSPVPKTLKEGMEAAVFLRNWMPRSQYRCVRDGMKGEEGQFFIDKMCELAERIRTTPVTYEQEGKGDEAIVYLHYFRGGADWYITEKDKGDSESTAQHQAFGLADLFRDGGELGYISIVELVANNVELDFHFTPKTLGEIRSKE